MTFMGKVVFNIGGLTIHSTLNICVGMVGWTNVRITRVFFLSGCDCKCYVLLHVLGLVNKDSFSNNRL